MGDSCVGADAHIGDGEGGRCGGGESSGTRGESMTLHGVVGLQAMVVHPVEFRDSARTSDGHGDGGRTEAPLFRLPKGVAKKLSEFIGTADPGQRLKVSRVPK